MEDGYGIGDSLSDNRYHLRNLDVDYGPMDCHHPLATQLNKAVTLPGTPRKGNPALQAHRTSLQNSLKLQAYTTCDDINTDFWFMAQC